MLKITLECSVYNLNQSPLFFFITLKYYLTLINYIYAKIGLKTNNYMEVGIEGGEV